MNTYIIAVSRVVHQCFEVNADSPEEALEFWEDSGSILTQDVDNMAIVNPPEIINDNEGE